MEAHLNSMHMKLKDFACALCDYRATQNSCDTRHMKAVHMKVSE
jgi:hypothetical protein